MHLLFYSIYNKIIILFQKTPVKVSVTCINSGSIERSIREFFDKWPSFSFVGMRVYSCNGSLLPLP